MLLDLVWIREKDDGRQMATKNYILNINGIRKRGRPRRSCRKYVEDTMTANRFDEHMVLDRKN